MSNTVKKIVAWIASILLAAGVIGITTYKVIVGETSTKDGLKQIATTAQQYASDTVGISTKDEKIVEQKEFVESIKTVENKK